MKNLSALLRFPFHRQISRIGQVGAIGVLVAACQPQASPLKCENGSKQSRVRFLDKQGTQEEGCQAEVQHRTCNDGQYGEWNGSYTQEVCSGQYEDCDGIPHGSKETRTRYQEATVPEDATCVSEEQWRTCNNGILGEWSGTFSEEACLIESESACGNVAHGEQQTRQRYLAEEVAHGETCTEEIQVRTCNHGVFSSWSGTYTAETCQEADGLPCDDTPHSGSQHRVRFSTAEVPFGSECQSEEQSRTCDNGTFGSWSGSYTHETCTVNQPAGNCDAIANHSGWELCQSDENSCSGVFTDGAGCSAFCAAAGMVCAARYGGEPGCQKEQHSMGCNQDGNQSDWCDCRLPTTDTNCQVDVNNPPRSFEAGKRDAVFTQRRNWVVSCSPHAYTAYGAEHSDCDSTYDPDGSRRGTAVYSFNNVPKGLYDVYVHSRHTANRNPAGALFKVNGVGVVINQRDDSGSYVWDYHGRHCLEGSVDVVLDSTVNGGSDATSGARLTPAL